MKLNISFFIKDDEWLDKCKIWDKVSKSIKKGFDSEAVYNKKYLKTKVRSYDLTVCIFPLT